MKKTNTLLIEIHNCNSPHSTCRVCIHAMHEVYRCAVQSLTATLRTMSNKKKEAICIATGKGVKGRQSRETRWKAKRRDGKEGKGSS